MILVDISKLSAPGDYLLVRGSQDFPSVFLCRIKTSLAPPGAVGVHADESIVGFSHKCSHMGCTLVPDPGTEPGKLPTQDGLLSCRCHSSCFDLANQGLPVIGPATDCLAAVVLRPTADPAKVEITGWLKERSVPYGVPYGGTTNKPNGGGDV